MPPLSRMLLTAGLLSLSAGATAQQPGPPPPGGPGSADAPMMHMPVTRAELEARLTQRFDQLDANHDGKISPEDRDARRAQMMEQMFARLDTNKDGAISKDEFIAAHSGQGAHAGMMDHGAMMGHDGMTGHDGMDGKGAPKPDGIPRPGPTPLSKSDFVARGLAMFDRVDTNHDGTLSPAEREAARAKMRSMREPVKSPPPHHRTPPQGQ